MRQLMPPIVPMYTIQRCRKDGTTWDRREGEK